MKEGPENTVRQPHRQWKRENMQTETSKYIKKQNSQKKKQKLEPTWQFSAQLGLHLVKSRVAGLFLNNSSEETVWRS